MAGEIIFKLFKRHGTILPGVLGLTTLFRNAMFCLENPPSHEPKIPVIHRTHKNPRLFSFLGNPEYEACVTKYEANLFMIQSY